MNTTIAELIAQLQEAISMEVSRLEQGLKETRNALVSLASTLPGATPVEALSIPTPSTEEKPANEAEPAITVEQTSGARPTRYLRIHTVLEIARELGTGFRPEDVAEKARAKGYENFSLRHLGQTMAHLAQKKKNPVLVVISPGRGRRPATYRFQAPE